MYSVCLSNLGMGVTLIMLPFSTFKILSGWLYRSITYSEMFLSPNQCLSFCIAQITDKDPQWFIVWVICMLPEIRCTGKISGSYAWNLVMGRLLPIKNLITSIKEYLANWEREHISYCFHNMCTKGAFGMNFIVKKKHFTNLSPGSWVYWAKNRY